MEQPLGPLGHRWAIGSLWPKKVVGPSTGGIRSTPVAQTHSPNVNQGERNALPTPSPLSRTTPSHARTGCRAPVEHTGVEPSLANGRPRSRLRGGLAATQSHDTPTATPTVGQA
jgi:hypothetical protein